MNKTLIAGGVAVLALAGMAGTTAIAQQVRAERALRGDTDGDDRISQTEFVQARVARLTALDANGDGQVTAEERVAGLQARKAERAGSRFDRMDTDHSGAVTQAEFGAQMAQRIARNPDANRTGGGFARLDADGDGQITRAEFDARRAQRAERGPRPARAERMAARAERVAARAERRAARGPAVIAEAETKATAAFARLDANGDGYVTAQERQAVRAERQERRAERVARRAAQTSASPAAPASE